MKQCVVLLGILIPFIGTSLGAAFVFFLKERLSECVSKVLMGFASGVMMAAAVWSLLLPAIDLSADRGRLAFVPATAGFLAGVIFLLVLDRVVPHFHAETNQKEGPESHLQKITMMIFAVTLHNIPEGMAVGVVFSNCLSATAVVTLAEAFLLALGIAIQNFPEGGRIRRAVRSCGAGGSSCHYTSDEADREPACVSACVCCRGDGICHRGRTGAGVVGKRKFGYGDNRICDWICCYDGPGCGIWGIKVDI